MAAKTLLLKIITPERIVLTQPVEQITATAIDGELTILPEHEPLVTALSIDVLRYKTKGGNEEVAAVLGGVLEVSDSDRKSRNEEVSSATEVTILSDQAELSTEIDEARAHAARERAEAEKLQKADDKLGVQVTEMALSKAMARLNAVKLGKTVKHRSYRDPLE